MTGLGKEEVPQDDIECIDEKKENVRSGIGGESSFLNRSPFCA